MHLLIYPLLLNLCFEQMDMSNSASYAFAKYVAQNCVLAITYLEWKNSNSIHHWLRNFIPESNLLKPSFFEFLSRKLEFRISPRSDVSTDIRRCDSIESKSRTRVPVLEWWRASGTRRKAVRLDLAAGPRLEDWLELLCSFASLFSLRCLFSWTVEIFGWLDRLRMMCWN